MQITEISKHFERIVRETSITSAIADKISPDADFVEDLGFDSLLTIRMIADVEETFKIDFDVEELVYEKIGRYGTLLDTIVKKVQEKELANE